MDETLENIVPVRTVLVIYPHRSQFAIQSTFQIDSPQTAIRRNHQHRLFVTRRAVCFWTATFIGILVVFGTPIGISIGNIASWSSGQVKTVCYLQISNSTSGVYNYTVEGKTYNFADSSPPLCTKDCWYQRNAPEKHSFIESTPNYTNDLLIISILGFFIVVIFIILVCVLFMLRKLERSSPG
jgi:hypothetical protein